MYTSPPLMALERGPLQSRMGIGDGVGCEWPNLLSCPPPSLQHALQSQHAIAVEEKGEGKGLHGPGTHETTRWPLGENAVVSAARRSLCSFSSFCSGHDHTLSVTCA